MLLPVTSLLPTQAVVPIFVNAGAAFLPALLAGIASVGAILFKPKELLAAMKRNPAIPIALVAVVGLGIVLWKFWPAGGHGTPTGPVVAVGGVADETDWAQVALAIIEDGGQAPYIVDQPVAVAPPVAVGGGGDEAIQGQGGDGNTAGGGDTSTIVTPPLTSGGMGTAHPETDHPKTGTSGVTPPKGHAVPPPTRVTMPTVGVGFRMNSARSGHDGGGSPTGLAEAWRFDAKGAFVFSSPTVYKGRVYGTTCVLEGALNYGTIFCLDAKTGARKWEIGSVNGKRLRGFFSSPAVSADGKRVAIGQGLHFDYNSNVIVLEAETGKVTGMVDTGLHVEGSPVIWGDVVIAGAGAVEDPKTDKAKGDTGFILAVDLKTAKELWRVAVVDPESSPMVADGVVYVGSGLNGNGVCAFAAKGDQTLRSKPTQLWKYSAPMPMVGAATVAGDLVLIAGGTGNYVEQGKPPAGVVVALDRKTGAERWKVKLRDAVMGAVAVVGTTAVVSGRTGEVIALNAKTGTELWRSVVYENEAAMASPAFTGKYVYAVSKSGYLSVMDVAKKGEVVEQVYLNDEAIPGDQGYSFSSPTVAGGMVYVGSETGGLLALKGGN